MVIGTNNLSSMAAEAGAWTVQDQLGLQNKMQFQQTNEGSGWEDWDEGAG